jgi:hypothetical protein
MSDSPLLNDPKPNPERYDTHVVNTWVAENQFIAKSPDQADLPSLAEARKVLPEPFWAGHAAAIACYWRAWELAFGNLKQPTPENGFAANFCDTAFNGNLFMWDSCFITCFGVYAPSISWGLWIPFIENNTRMGSFAVKYRKRTARIVSRASILQAPAPM